MTGILFLQANLEAPKTIQLNLVGTDGFILGRSDTKSGYLVDVNLADFNALDKGVSRRHAALVYYEDKLHILDLGSANGTFLNGQRLMADTPYMLNVGDQLSLGQLALTLSYSER